MDKYEYLKFDEVVVDGTQWLKETLELVRAKVTGAVSSTIGLSSWRQCLITWFTVFSKFSPVPSLSPKITRFLSRSSSKTADFTAWWMVSFVIEFFPPSLTISAKDLISVLTVDWTASIWTLLLLMISSCSLLVFWFVISSHWSSTIFVDAVFNTFFVKLRTPTRCSITPASTFYCICGLTRAAFSISSIFLHFVDVRALLRVSSIFFWILYNDPGVYFIMVDVQAAVYKVHRVL